MSGYRRSEPPAWAGRRFDASPDSDEVGVRWNKCPDCRGRGYFCAAWDATKAGDGDFYQCNTCLKAKEEHDKNISIKEKPAMTAQPSQETVKPEPTQEDWKDVPEFGGKYEASTLGRIRIKDSGKFPKTHLDMGYPRIHLFHSRKDSCWMVHRVIALTFLPPRPKGMHCAHQNGIKTDNRVCNLSWKTHKENVLDSMRLGERPIGEEVAGSKLKEHQVIEIRNLYKAGRNCEAIAEKYGMHVRTIYKIVSGTSWKHLL